MTPLERLFRFEIAYHERLRIGGTDEAHASGAHTGYALQAGYEGLVPRAGRAGRDVLAAKGSTADLLGLGRPNEPVACEQSSLMAYTSERR